MWKPLLLKGPWGWKHSNLSILQLFMSNIPLLSHHHICNPHMAWGHFFFLIHNARGWMLSCPLWLPSKVQSRRGERNSLCCVLPAPPELLYSTGLKPIHGWVSMLLSQNPVEQGIMLLVMFIIKRFPWVVFSRNVSCLFSGRGAV